MPVLRFIQSEEHQTPGGTRLEDDFLLKGAKSYARNNKPQALQVGLGRGPTRIPDQEHLGRGLCAPAMLGREKLAGNRYNSPADQKRPGALAQAQSTAHDPRGDIRRIWKPRPLGGRLAQTGVQRAEGCFIYFSICWLLVVALAHVRQAKSSGGVAQAHKGREGADLPAWLGAASRCLCVVCSPGHPSAGLWTTSLLPIAPTSRKVAGSLPWALTTCCCSLGSNYLRFATLSSGSVRYRYSYSSDQALRTSALLVLLPASCFLT